MNNNNRNKLWVAVLMLSGFSFSESTLAQSGNRNLSLEEVIVTATRRQESIQDIPVSITAISASALQDRGITNFSDISQVAAGVHLNSIANMTDTSVKIRGVGSQGQGSAVPSVGILVDGVYQLRDGAAFSEMLDVERIEVLRGPQGTLFGKNSTAGAILIHTKDPSTEEFSGRIQGVVGNLDTAELRGAVNIPLIEDKLAVRLTGYTAKRDGYTDNRFVPEDTRNTDREGGRIKLLWNATDNLELKLTAETFKQSSRMDDAMAEYGPNLAAYQPLPAIELGKFQQNPGKVGDEVERYILHANWDLPNHTLSSISAYEIAETFQLVDYDKTILQLPGVPAYIYNESRTEATTQEFQLSSDWDGNFNYVVGIFWQNEKLESNTDLIMADQSHVTRPPSLRDNDSQAVFGNATYQISDDWKFTVGVRYSDNEATGTNSQFTGPVITFREWTYSTKLQWQATDSAMLYLAYDTGFKDGGVNRELSSCGRPGGSCVTEDQATWDPEFSYNHELGFKTLWLDRRLQINGAVFYQEYEDFQVTTSLPREASTIVSNAAQVESKGIELDFQFTATQTLSIDGSLAWIHTKYKEYENAPCQFEGCSPSGSQDLSGKTLDIAPKLTANFGAEYRSASPWGDALELFSRVDLSYKSEYNAFSGLSDKTKQDAYTLTSLRVGLESPDSWKVTVWGNNLTDEDYVVAAEHTYDGLFLIPGLSRTYGVTFDLYF